MKDLARELGPDFAYVAKKKAIVHAPTKTEFVLVPGGVLTMGFSIDDVLALERVINHYDARMGEVPRELERARPVHVRAIEPFLVARRRVSHDDVTPLQAMTRAKKAGFRLLSEAEWEWIAREGGAVRFTGVRQKDHPVTEARFGITSDKPNGFGVTDLHEGYEWVADAWHPNYQGAPNDAKPWEGPPGTGRMGHTQWQDTIEIVSLHAAARGQAKRASFRYALDVPTKKKTKTPKLDYATTMKEMLATLVSEEPKPALEAFDLLCSIRVEDDIAALLEAIEKRRKRFSPKVWGDLAATTALIRDKPIAKKALGKLPNLRKEAARVIVIPF